MSSLHKPEYQAWLEELLRGLDVISGSAECQTLDLHDYTADFRHKESSSTIAEEDVHWIKRSWHHSQSIRGSVKEFWREQIVVHIGQEECRDHYGKFCSHSFSGRVLEVNLPITLV